MSVIHSQQVSWWAVHTFITPVLEKAVSWPLVGAPAWCELPDDDPLKQAALLDAAQHWALRLETCQAARCEAGRDIAAAADWSVVARDVRNRAEFYTARPWLQRVMSDDEPKKDRDPRSSIAAQLVKHCLNTYILGSTDTGDPYGVHRDMPHIVKMLRGGKNGLRGELAKWFFDEHKTVASQDALANACATLEGYAAPADSRRVYLRRHLGSRCAAKRAERAA